MSNTKTPNDASNLEEYIHESNIMNASRQGLQTTWIGDVEVWVLQELPEDFDLALALEKIKDTVPSVFLSLIDSIYIGQFDFLKEKDLVAAYHESAIYVTNEQFSTSDMVDDIVHELAHAAEEAWSHIVYIDGQVEQEFLSKRKTLVNLLNMYGIDIPKQLQSSFLNPDYIEAFDAYLYKDVGYETLAKITAGLFITPYGITSINEYFANVFEHFYLDGTPYEISKISPAAVQKIQELNQSH